MIKNNADRKRQKLENKILEGGTASNDSRYSIPKNTTAELENLDRHTGTIAYDLDQGKVVFDDGTGFSAISDVTPDMAIVSTLEYAGTDSFQNIAADLELDAAAGSDDGTDTSFIAPIMGNVLGDSVQGEGNYMAGVIGAISVTGADSDYPTGGILGIVMDGVTNVDGAVVAVIDGSDPSAETRARAAYAVRMLNNNADSGVDYGLDLYDAGSPHFTGTGEDFTVDKAEIRTSKEVCLLNDAAAPVDGTTGDNFAGPGSLYIDTDAPALYMNTGSKVAPVWSEVGAGGSTGWAVYSFDYLDFVTGNEAESNVELVVVEIPANTFVEKVLLYIDDAWNDPGDGMPIYVNLAGQTVAGQADLSGSGDFYLISTAAALATAVEVNTIARDITVVVNPAEFGAHTMTEITSGSLRVYVKTTALP
jgi:hypothetical protein